MVSTGITVNTPNGWSQMHPKLNKSYYLLPLYHAQFSFQQGNGDGEGNIKYATKMKSRKTPGAILCTNFFHLKSRLCIHLGRFYNIRMKYQIRCAMGVFVYYQGISCTETRSCDFYIEDKPRWVTRICQKACNCVLL